MHKRAAVLILAAAELRRELWRSLPAEIQVREFLRTANSKAINWGASVYQIFAQHGIEGTGIKDPTRPVRPGPGKEFGLKVFNKLLGKLNGREEAANDVMQDFFTRFWSKGQKNLRPDSTLAQAESYVFTGVINQNLNSFRKKTEKSVENTVDGESVSMYDSTPDEKDDKPKLDLRRLPSDLKSKISHIHRDAELYLKLSGIEGYSDREILGELSDPSDKNSPIKPETSMLKHPYNASGEPLKEKTWNNIKSKILKALHEYAGGDVDNLFEG